jgi:hypothetical protein
MPRKKQPSIAVKKALEQIQKTEETQSAYKPISVMLTEAQLKKLEEITTQLPLNKRFALNLVIWYAITYANKKKQPIERLRGFPKKFGNRPIEIEPTADTIMMLTENNLMDKSKELVVFGLKVFHQRLFNIK